MINKNYTNLSCGLIVITRMGYPIYHTQTFLGVIGVALQGLPNPPNTYLPCGLLGLPYRGYPTYNIQTLLGGYCGYPTGATHPVIYIPHWEVIVVTLQGLPNLQYTNLTWRLLWLPYRSYPFYNIQTLLGGYCGYPTGATQPTIYKHYLEVIVVTLQGLPNLQYTNITWRLLWLPYMGYPTYNIHTLLGGYCGYPTGATQPTIYIPYLEVIVVTLQGLPNL